MCQKMNYLQEIQVKLQGTQEMIDHRFPAEIEHYLQQEWVLVVAWDRIRKSNV